MIHKVDLFVKLGSLQDENEITFNTQNFNFSRIKQILKVDKYNRNQGRTFKCIASNIVSETIERIFNINLKWSDWSVFTPCSRTCGIGYQKQTRYCVNTRHEKCSGQLEKFIYCYMPDCKSNKQAMNKIRSNK